eukprot:7840883-Pyramimonas_sp.AAC.1
MQSRREQRLQNTTMWMILNMFLISLSLVGGIINMSTKLRNEDLMFGGCLARACHIVDWGWMI